MAGYIGPLGAATLSGMLIAEIADAGIIATTIFCTAIGALYLHQQKQEAKRQKESACREDKLMEINEKQRLHTQTVLLEIVKDETEAKKILSHSLDLCTAHISQNTESLNIHTEQLKALHSKLSSQQPRRG